MSKRTTGKTTSPSPTPAPRRRKTPAADAPAAPKTARSRRKLVSSETGEAPVEVVAPSADEIAMRAYFIALERGFPGDPVADWLQAERQLRDDSRS